MKIILIIEGRPMSKDNEKFFNKAVGRPFTSSKFKKYERQAAWQAHQQMKANRWTMFDQPIFVKMTFYFKGGIRLDLFNCPKSICDALNGLVWKDDRQIHKGYVEIKTDVRERIEIEAWNIAETQETLSFENDLQIK